MDDLIRDIRYGVRLFARNRGVAAAAVVTLGLGTGAVTAVFSVVNGVLLRPLPYAEAERLVMVWETYPPEGIDHLPASAPDFVDWQAQNRVFDRMAAMVETYFNLTEGGDPERVRGAQVSADLFSLLGVSPGLGRALLAEEQRAGQDKVVVLSDGLWRRRFGADPSVVGGKILLSGESHTVVGVMPRDFRFPPPFTRDGQTYAVQHEMWVPLVITPEQLDQRLIHYLKVMARLRAEVTPAQAQADMEAIVAEVNETYPDVHADMGAQVRTLHEQVVGYVEPALLLLLGAVALLLLIACANVANLLLVRATMREREVAIRTALGANRSRLIRQWLTESLILAVAGGTLGLLLSQWSLRLLLALVPGTVPRLDDIRLDIRVLALTLAASVLTGLLFGLAPAWHASKVALLDALKETGSNLTQGSRRQGLRSGLVIGEIALALILVVGASLLFRSFLSLRQVDPGFKSGNLLVFDLPLLKSKYPEDRERAAFCQRLVQELETLPGVAAAGANSHPPLAGPGYGHLALIEGRQITTLKDIPTTSCGAVTPGYFRAMGIPLLEGRTFTWLDTADSSRVAVINKTMARRFWPDTDPVGKRIKQGRPEDDAPWLTIVGVVGDVRHDGLTAEIAPEVYLSRLQDPFRNIPQADPGGMSVVVRARSDPSSLLPSVRSTVLNLDPELPISNVRTMEETIHGSVSRPRFNMLLLGVFAAVALALATVGVYGLVACSVADRTHEVGIRIAIGARGPDVVKLVAGEALKLAVVGVGLGVGGGAALSRLMSGLLYGVSNTDPLSFAGAALVLLVAALLASYFPARKATTTDPTTALRHE